MLVIGSGAAGVMAALRAARMGCRVVLASKLPQRSGNSAISMGAWIVPSEDLPPDVYFEFVMEAGKHVNDAKLVRILAQRGEQVMGRLRELGLPLERMDEKYWIVKRGTSRKGPGILLMDALLKNIHHERIKALPWFSVIELLVDEGRASGAIGVSKDEGQLVIDAKSVVLATGGGGGIYGRHDNHRKIMGDGYWLSLKIGLPLRDMEFVQCWPLALWEPDFPTVVIDEPFPKEARVINSEGEDLIQKYGLPVDLDEAAAVYRDQFSVVVSREGRRGKVYLDYTGVSDEGWQNPPLNRLMTMSPDFRHRPFSVAPVVHFFMGGVEINGDTQTAIPGLFAAGEVTSGVHGANRVGGNALTECFVFGDLAGESAARNAMQTGRRRFKREITGWGFTWRDETGTARQLFREIQGLTWDHAGPIRDAESLQEGLSRISRIESKLARLDAAGRSIELNEVKGSLLISKAIMTAGLDREESRGAHFREDFPRRDDENWLKNIFLRLDRETGDLIVSHRAVTGL